MAPGIEHKTLRSKEALVKQLKQITITQARNRTLYRVVQGVHEAQRFIKRVEATSAVKRHASAVKQTVANGIATRRTRKSHASAGRAKP